MMGTARQNGSIVISQVGGLGDLVLTSHLLAGLRRQHPDTHLSLVCRRSFAGIVEHFPVCPDAVVPVSVDPYASDVPIDALRTDLENVRESAGRGSTSVVIAAEHKPTWFTYLLGCGLRPQQALATTAVTASATGDHYCRQLGLSHGEWKQIEAGHRVHELARYDAIIEHLDGTRQPFCPWSVDESAARQIVSEMGLTWKRYLIAFPFGVAGVPQKRWPAERFASILQAVIKDAGDGILLLGAESERADLEHLQSCLTGDVRVYAGSASDISKLVAAVAGSRAYLGNDTGPMHLAGALGIPGVAIYGGGHWPAYAPWAAGSIGFVNKLPCFNCDWDCLFHQGLCVDAIDTASVESALKEVLTWAHQALHHPPESRELSNVPGTATRWIASASKRYRSSQKDRAERLDSIIHLHNLLATARAARDAATEIASERLVALETQAEAYNRLSTEADRRLKAVEEVTAILNARDDRIDDLERVAAERLAALTEQDEAYRVLDAEADRRTQAIEELTRVVAHRERRTRELEDVAAERLASLETQLEAYRRLERESDQRLRDVHQMTASLAVRDRRMAELEAELQRRLDDVNELTAVVRARDQRISDLEAEIRARLQDVNELASVIAARERRIAELEPETDRRLRDVHELTAIVAAREKRIAELETEAERRLHDVHELTAIVSARDRRIADLEHKSRELANAVQVEHSAVVRLGADAEERLVALNRMDSMYRALAAEAEKRLQAIETLSEMLKERPGSSPSETRKHKKKPELPVSATSVNTE